MNTKDLTLYTEGSQYVQSQVLELAANQGDMTQSGEFKVGLRMIKVNRNNLTYNFSLTSIDSRSWGNAHHYILDSIKHHILPKVGAHVVVLKEDNEAGLHQGETFTLEESKNGWWVAVDRDGSSKKIGRHIDNFYVIAATEPKDGFESSMADVMGADSTIDVSIATQQENGSVKIYANGYGVKGTGDTEGYPIVIENNGGELTVHIWADINRKDPTHSISLRGASIGRRGKTLPLF
ncbi:hypothetical protein [Vibrio sp. Evd11]|uniref:hypothetical protein n=1 Tax=Vibrio sp. Evd11 TaxID=1207404 RepID=UPI000EFACF38|nr:hypothetical protein [Vibrio sp. Evd11]